MVGTSSSPGEWIAAASALTPAWITTIWRLAQIGGHRRGKRGRGGGCALDWSGGGAEGEKGGDGGARSLLKRRGGEAEEGGMVRPGAAPCGEKVGEGPGHDTRGRRVCGRRPDRGGWGTDTWAWPLCRVLKLSNRSNEFKFKI
jgi:hypothetical protein